MTMRSHLPRWRHWATISLTDRKLIIILFIVVVALASVVVYQKWSVDHQNDKLRANTQAVADEQIRFETVTKANCDTINAVIIQGIKNTESSRVLTPIEKAQRTKGYTEALQNCAELVRPKKTPSPAPVTSPNAPTSGRVPSPARS